MTTILLLCAFVLVVAYALNHITFNEGYAKCIWQMSDKFNELISVFETLYAEQMKGGQYETN